MTARPAPAPVPRSTVAGIHWPALTDVVASGLLAVMFQLEQSQRWPAADLLAQQFRQLDALVAHAYRTVPFHRRRLAAAGYRPDRPLTAEIWSRLPILSRREVQDAGASLHARELPPKHGRRARASTSGSTGMPLQLVNTELTRLFWHAFTLRDHFWQRRDLKAKVVVIRRNRNADGAATIATHFESWGQPLASAFETGSTTLLDIRSGVEEQTAWLQQENPDYLFTFPSNLALLARHFSTQGLSLPRLRQARTFGEVVGEDTRAICRQGLGVEITDVYSAEEAGYIALQCPDHEHYHVQSEGVLVEILTETGQPCAEGQVGQVVVSPLHNFAMPLLRYALGDHAEPGPPCSCGRTLPVIRRIFGKSRNLLVLPSGERRYAYHGGRSLIEIPAIVQFQLVQRTPDQIDLKLAVRRPLTPDEESRAREAVLSALRYPFDLRLVYVDAIPRSPSGKYEDFLSAIG